MELAIIQTAIWAVVALLLGCIAGWCLERYLQARFALAPQAAGEAEATLRERLLAIAIAEATKDETVALQKAKLALETAKIIMATERLSDLEGDQIAAEREVIVANAAARKRLAEEFARIEHEAGLDPTIEQLVDAYARYMESMSSRNGFLHFNDFTNALLSREE